MKINTMQCNTMQCNAIQYNTMQCNTMQYNTIQYNTIQYNAMQSIAHAPAQVLYVAFGGRFGLEYYGKNNRATPPGRSNAVYEDFYKSRNENHYNHHSSNSYDRYGGDSSRASSSSSAWGGYYSYTMVVGAVACIAQRFFGVSPYQAIFFVTTLMGRRGGRVFPRRRYGGWGGMGLGGGGGGFGNYNFRHRRGGMWGR
jgi:hypothetical protein